MSVYFLPLLVSGDYDYSDKFPFCTVLSIYAVGLLCKFLRNEQAQ